MRVSGHSVAASQAVLLVAIILLIATSVIGTRVLNFAVGFFQ